jgi:parallel beta-helix repeat protein
MKNRLNAIIIVCFLTSAGFLVFITFEPKVVSAGNIIYVGSGPGNDSVTIQGGVDLASDGDTVFVYNGTYYENVDVVQIINLTGEDKNATIIDGGGFFSVVHVTANWVNITGFTITNGFDSIRMKDNNNNSIINNIVSDSTYGITLQYSMNNRLVNNTMLGDGINIIGENPDVWNTHSIDTSNTVNGKPVFYWKNQNGGTIPPGAGQVILANCTNVRIENQNVSNGSVGIQVGFSNNNYIAKNSVSSNTMYGIHLFFSDYNTLTNNTAYMNDVNGIYFYRSSNNTVTGNNASNNGNDGITIVGGTHNTVTSNDVFSNLNWGIALYTSIPWGESTGNTIGNNNVQYNGGGIAFGLVTLSNIINNNASNNGASGIQLGSGSNKINITNNDVSNNMWGIYISGSSNNNIYHNNIINNSIQAIDDSNNGNQWDNGYSISFNPVTDGGNYWSDFDEPSEGAYDEKQGYNQDIMGSDGIVDMGVIGGKNPYVIDADSQDNYPLINPYDDTSPPIITNLQPPDGSTTNDDTPTISANYSDPSGINVSSVLLKVDGIDVTFSATVTAVGVSYIPGTALPDGIHTVYLEVKDTFGNLAIAAWIFIVDTTPPIITNPQPPDASITNDNTPMISADYSDPSGIDVGSVVLEVDGIDVTLSATVTTSEVSYIPGTALPDGVHTVYLEVKDIYGYLATATWSFTVDTLPPVITNLQPPDTSTTNDSTPTISADYSDPLGIDVNSVLLMVNGVNVTSFATVTAGDVSYLPGLALPDGIHTVYLEVRDNGGNLATATWSFTVEATPPTITNLQPPDGSTTNDNTTIISADYSDPSGINVSSVLLKFDGIDVTSFATITASNVSFIPATVLPDGVHTVYLEVKDIYDNLATIMWNFTVDTLAPIITNLQPPDASTTNDSTPIIAADYNDTGGINVSSVVLKVDGIDVTSFATVTASNITYIPGITLSNDIHTVYLEVRDIYGNLATVTWNFTVDTLPPIITNLQPPDLSTTNDSTPIFSADYSDLSGIDVSSVMLKVDGVDVTLSATVMASGVSYIPGVPISDGIHTVILEVKDNAGNLATIAWSFTVDATPPIITNLQPPDTSTTNYSTPIIGVDYSDLSGINASSVVLEVDSIDVTSFSTVTAGGVIYIPGVALSEGLHSVYLEVRDNVDNLATATWSFSVDSNPPAIINLQPPNLSITNDSTPTINADYSDPSGINISSVLLEVDNVDMTSSAVVTGGGVSYVPATTLSDGIHTIYLEIKDNVGNLATASWSFTVDTTPPIITNLQPPDSSTTNDSTPMIIADYSDSSGINLGSVLLEIDGIDLTLTAMITTSGVTFTPDTALSEGIHTVYLEVRDNVGNLATVTWNFTVDTLTPTFTNLQPPDLSTTNDSIPPISADYSDTGGINVSSVVLEVDGIDVTSSAVVTANGVSYTPGTELVDGTHTVILWVEDVRGNLGTVSWSFDVDTTSPTISNLQPDDASTINDVSPTIGADYYDISGIDVNNIILLIDGIDVISSATVTVGRVSYTPGLELAEGQHTVYLEVRDIYGNLETVSWSFYVDYPPIIETWEPGGTPDQTYTQGDVITITWIAYDGNPLPVNPINITYGDMIGGWTIIATNEPNNGIYTWDSTGVTPGAYWVNLSVYDSFGHAIFDIGNYSFIINFPVTYPPEIADVKAEPDSQRVGKEVTISATVSDPDTDLDDLTVKVNISKPDKTPLGNFSMTYNSTSGKYTYSTNYDLKGTYTFVIWTSDKDGNWATTDSTFFMEPKPEPDEYNWKPIIALIFTIILLISGILLSFKRPLKFKGKSEKDRLYTFLIGVLPFAAAESATGVISLFTGLLRIPPILGVGMIVDLIILISGILSCIMIFRKWSSQVGD